MFPALFKYSLQGPSDPFWPCSFRHMCVMHCLISVLFKARAQTSLDSDYAVNIIHCVLQKGSVR